MFVYLNVELTVPWEDRIEESHQNKGQKYDHIVAEAIQNGWRAHCFPVEVGCMSFPAKSFSWMLRSLGLPSTKCKNHHRHWKSGRTMLKMVVAKAKCQLVAWLNTFPVSNQILFYSWLDNRVLLSLILGLWVSHCDNTMSGVYTAGGAYPAGPDLTPSKHVQGIV